MKREHLAFFGRPVCILLLHTNLVLKQHRAVPLVIVVKSDTIYDNHEIVAELIFNLIQGYMKPNFQHD